LIRLSLVLYTPNKEGDGLVLGILAVSDTLKNNFNFFVNAFAYYVPEFISKRESNLHICIKSGTDVIDRNFLDFRPRPCIKLMGSGDKLSRLISGTSSLGLEFNELGLSC